MPRSRLLAALDEGLALPDGPVLALRPPAVADLSMLPRERVLIDHTFRPDRDAWAGAGYRLAEDGAEAPTSLAFVPRSKALARALVARAARSGLVLIDGQRDDGVDALWREVRARRPDAEGLALAHGRLAWFRGGPEAEAAFADWAMPAPSLQGHLFTQPGVFSEGGLDRGSALLAAALPARLPPRMADFGAGVGALAGAVLAREGVVSLDLVEAERLALDCARLNVADPRARFLWADALGLSADEWDGIVMNPPFHAARAATPALGQAFVAAAARRLARDGQLWLVANRHLPYEAALAEAFRDTETVGGDSAFKVVRASHPRAAQRPVARPGTRPGTRGVTRRAAPGRR